MNEPRIAILGTVEVIGSGRTVSLPGTNLPTLLSLLALAPGRAVANERLIEALWPDVDPVKAGRSLISLVHQLNVTLSTHLGLHRAVGSVKGVGRVLRVDPDSIDLVRFERRLAEGDEHTAAGREGQAVDAYEASLALWRGDPFGGADVRALVEPSTRLQIARQRCEAALIDVSLRAGRGAALVPWLLQRVDAEPLDERLARDAARALYQAGRSSDALDVVRACVDHLRENGIEPSALTRQLEVDVLDHSLDAASTDVVADRHLDDELIGRQAARATLDAWHVGTAGSSIMAVRGQAGIGKTALIRSWTRRSSDTEVSTLEDLRAPSGDVARSPHEQFDDIVRRLAMSGAARQLLVIDDGQWLPIHSIALVRHLLWHPDVEGLHVLMGVRSPDVDDNPALVQLLHDATRSRRAHEVRLVPLDRVELDELLTSRGASGFGGAEELLRLTGGNPSFALSVLRGEVGAETEPVPADVLATLGRYLARVGERSRTILEIAAALGPEGDAAHLASVASASELDVMDALDDVGRGRLLHVDPIGGSYRFVHELARRVVLTAGTRRGSV